jgi:hypothetical protein
MKTNSRPNNTPAASRPGRSEPSRPAEFDAAPARPGKDQHRTKPAERIAACMMGLISVVANFIATCWKPQIAHSSTIRAKAPAPGASLWFMPPQPAA